VIGAPDQGGDRRRIGGGLVHRSDQGVPYVSTKYTERLVEAWLAPSVGSMGKSYDNGLAETINRLYKAEMIWRRDPSRSLQAVRFVALEFVDWFDNCRLLEPTGNILRADAEAAYYAAMEVPAKLAAHW
jgi:transposase InsO family protein